MKDKLKKWQAPKMSQLNIKETQGGIANQSEDYIKPNGIKASGRDFGGAGS